MKTIFIYTALLFSLACSAVPIPASATDHYCDDQEQWKKWADLVAKFPEDDDLAIGYALRIGLCEQIKAGSIEQDRAIDLFDRYLNALRASTAEREREILKDDLLKKGGI